MSLTGTTGTVAQGTQQAGSLHEREWGAEQARGAAGPHRPSGLCPSQQDEQHQARFWVRPSEGGEEGEN